MIAGPAHSHGAIQKCVDGAGKVSYQDGPCATGKAAAEIQRDRSGPDPAAAARSEAAREALAERTAGLDVTPEERKELRREIARYMSRLVTTMRAPDAGSGA